jgi:NADPH-dependent 2,4-dienoyl-CoA reductase/sulfur reductase-like enzyme
VAEPLVRDVDVLVIGAGPAGIAAACAAAEAGRGVSVIDDNPAAGGQIWRGGPGAAGGDAQRWLDRFARSGAELQPATAVIDVRPGDGLPATIRTRSPAAVMAWRPRSLILAAGARERHLPFPGWTLPGVVGAGGLQALVKQGLDVRGRRIVIGGSGPLLLAVADLLVSRGAVVVAVAEQATLRRLAVFAGTLLVHPGKLVQAIAIRRAIGPVLRAGTFPVAARASEGGLVVSLASGPPGRERHRELACDILACGFGLVPNVDVARAVGCDVDRGGIVIDALCRTSVPGVWAAGECAGVGGVDKSLVEGLVAGLGAAGHAAAAARWVPAARRQRRFASALDRTFRLDRRLLRLAGDDTIVCRCEDVALGRLAGHTCWREAKLMTRLGMGPCQGRVCGPIVETVFGWEAGDGRPPLTEVPLADLA